MLDVSTDRKREVCSVCPVAWTAHYSHTRRQGKIELLQPRSDVLKDEEICIVRPIRSMATTCRPPEPIVPRYHVTLDARQPLICSSFALQERELSRFVELFVAVVLGIPRNAEFDYDWDGDGLK